MKPTLELGVEGAEVRNWQKRLIALGLYSDARNGDGQFGPITAVATKQYQSLLRGAGHYYGAIDGIVGSLTYAADESFVASVQGVPSPTPSSTLQGKDDPKKPSSDRIYELARTFLGTKEYPGPVTNPVIAKMMLLAPDWLDQDDSKTAWCGIFRGYLGHVTGTGLPSEHYRAAAWLKWGEPVPLSQAKRGDTVICKTSAGNHVALFDEFVEVNKVRLLGGNQSNAVTRELIIPSTSVTGVRRLA